MLDLSSDFSQYLPIRGVQEDQTGSLSESQEQKLRKVCQDFESIFIAKLLQSMRGSGEKSTLFGESTGAGIFQSLFDAEVSNKIARGGGIGLADILYQSLSKNGIMTKSNESSPAIGVSSKSIPRPKRFSKTLFESIGKYHKLIDNAGKKFGVPQHIIYGVIAQESSGKADVVSHAGAKGLMQLMDETAADLGVKNPFNPKENIFGGVSYLKQQLQRFDNNLELALAAYNAGPSAVEKYGGIPPYRETQDYVQKVLKYAHEFEPKLQIQKEAS